MSDRSGETSDIVDPGIEPLHVVGAILGMTSVASLLGWVYGVASFATLFWVVTVPGMGALVVIGVVSARSPTRRAIREALVVGTIGGLVGVVGYDLIRVPFTAFGLRLFAPIESYGVLLTGASSSSPFTDFAGWAYHISNGIGFGIAYACLARRRHWGWGVAWALVLETGTVLTPFATMYDLSGKTNIIAIAYLAHIPYGLAIGATAWRPAWASELTWFGRRATVPALCTALVGLVAWQVPWSQPDLLRDGRAVADGPSAVIAGGDFVPSWLVVAPGGCAAVRNDDTGPHTMGGGDTGVAALTVPAGETVDVCPTAAEGVLRLKLEDEPYTGGWLIVDPER